MSLPAADGAASHRSGATAPPPAVPLPRPAEIGVSEPPRRITDAEFKAIAGHLHDKTGIRIVPGKETMVMGRLEKRLRALGLRTYSQYFDHIRRPGNELEHRAAIDLLTTNETYFFREPKHFEFLRDVLAPAHTTSRPFRVWSAASSSGEEAYTTAMVLADAMPQRQWEIVGTDISSRVVERSRTGIYPIAAAEKIPQHYLRRFCLKGRGEYEGMLGVAKELRSRTTFRCANLLEDLSSLGRFDLILLRNVMIYFEQDTKADIIRRLQTMLQPGGHLMVSHSETLNGLPTLLKPVAPSIYRLPGDEDDRA